MYIITAILKYSRWSIIWLKFIVRMFFFKTEIYKAAQFHSNPYLLSTIVQYFKDEFQLWKKQQQFVLHCMVQ